MAEEDILWGKNRHFFGGIEPSNMRIFDAVANEVDGSPVVTITARGPVDTVITDDYHNICEVGGYVIRKSETDYPKDEFDGELIYEEIKPTVLRTVTDSNVETGKVYYYAAFPYSKQGVYNRNKANRAIVDLSGGRTYLYGYDLDLDDSNPNTRVSYPKDVDNSSYNEVARMDFDTDKFKYGRWNLTPGEHFMPKPCMLKFDGTVEYYLNPNDYSLKEDGSASDITNTAYAGNAMMEWPKIYTKRWEENGVYHFRCSDVKIDDDWDCWCNYDINNNEIDHFYTAIYQGYYVKTDGSYKIRSLSGFAPAINNNISNFSKYAKNNGTNGWDIGVLSDRLLITDLLVMIAKTTNLQSACGIGARTYGTTKNSGLMNTKGLFYGTQTTGEATYPVKIFGMENWWGNLQQFTLGWCLKSGVSGLKFTAGTVDGSSSTGYNLDGKLDGYRTDIIPTLTEHVIGYITGCMTTQFGRVPYIVGGSDTTYETDYIYLTCNDYWRTLTVGEVSDQYHPAGPFNLEVTSSSSTSDSNTTVSLSCKPSKA